MEMLKNDAMIGNFKKFQINPTEGVTINQVVRGNLVGVQTVGVFGQITRLVAFFKEGMETLGVWMDRSRKRRQLLKMEQYALKDIGVTSSDARSELNKWYWLSKLDC